MRRAGWLVGAVFALAVLPAVASAGGWTLDADAWAVPRSGERILAMAPVHAAVAAWSRRARARLVLRHAGGEDGDLWAAQLRQWLIALGVPGRAVVTRIGGTPGRLELRVEGVDDG